ncbi:MAG: TonB-dependent receptor plug domain-containing protein [Lentimicrobium sp.]
MKRFPLTCFLFFLATACLFAQQPVMDTLNLKGVEVTGKKPGEEERSATPMQRLSVSELKVMPGSSVADALRIFSGVTVKDYGGLGGMKTAVVRSLGANHTGVFVDGVPLSDAATGQVDLGKIPLENLESIELFIGQEQQLCLPARARASAGILEFHTVMPDLSLKKMSYKTGIKTGSFGLINPFGSIYMNAGKKTVAGLTANYNHTRGDYPYVLKNGSQPDTTLRRRNGDLGSLNLNMNTETRFGDSSVLKVKSWLYTSEQGLPGAVIYYNPYSVQRMNTLDFFGNIQYARTSGKVNLLSNVTFTDGNLRYRDPAYLNQEGGLDNHYFQQEYYLSQAVSLPLGGIFSLGAAADLMLNTMEADQYFIAEPSRLTGLASVILRAETKHTEASLGLIGTMVNESSAKGQVTSSRKALSPSFSFITRLSNNPLLRLRLMYRNSFRMPTFHDLYYNISGNTGLKPEIVNQFNAGLILLKETGPLQLNFQTDVFLNRVKDKIVAVPSQNLFVWSMRNLGNVEIRGIEIQAGILTGLSATTELSANLNYTHQQALDITAQGSSTYGHQIPYVPFQTLSGLFTLNGKHLAIGYSLLYSSHRYLLGENIAANLLPSYWLHDLSVSWQQPLKSVTWKVKAEVVNLFNAQYEVIKGFPMNGRGFFITLSINY